jgi:hypothetical protein
MSLIRVTAAAREPLVHFLVLGAAIYGLAALFGGSPEEAPDERTIRITAGQIAWLEGSWEKRWNRLPTPAERAGLIKEFVRETVLYREALAMGLDRDDTIVRRRLAQKLEFLSQDLLAPPVPEDEELRAWFEANAERYREPALLTFTHVFVDPDRREDRTLADADAILAELRALPSPGEGGDALGDPFMLQRYYPERSEPEVAKLFGREFARELAGLSVGQWHGPVLSGYGVHLVYVHHREEARNPELAAVRDRVAQDWLDERREELNQEFYAGLLARYTVIVDDEPRSDDVAALEADGQ